MNTDNLYLLQWKQDNYPNEILQKYAEINAINTKQSLYGKLLVQMIVYRRFGINRESQKYLRGDYGKPYLSNLGDFYFNISHSASVVAVATSNQQIGIDIEQIDCADDAVAKHFFAADEQEFIAYASAHEKSKRFYQIWTAKEAYIKYCGTGLNKSLSSFSVLEEPLIHYIDSYMWNNRYIFSICQKTKHIFTCSVISTSWFEKQATNFLNNQINQLFIGHNCKDNKVLKAANINKLSI